jgi:hypothetical protein
MGASCLEMRLSNLHSKQPHDRASYQPVASAHVRWLRFLEAAPGIKYKAGLIVGYGAGLRVSEIAFLKVSLPQTIVPSLRR